MAKLGKPGNRLGTKGQIAWNKGLKGVQTHSLETRKKISEGMKGVSPRWLKGMVHSEESKRKQSEALRGEKSHLYIDGRTKLPGYHSYIDHNRKMRKLNNGGSHTFADWQALKEKYGFICPRCLRKEPEIVLTRDHIVPIKLGGSDDISNLQPLCKNCNSSKRCNIIKYEPVYV